ncbi:Gfo/Idh/MocA family protein [Thalassotalea crassostreae]|uniref:Gfo/Idh/MocA family protein n=1 Tax=Thalassotalea crassostreae TaxID=1763536 RepID=UPI0008389E91|nr:Gfo/Idh/MocA family oxidoreductase [Thalassotalea crassostreae]
MKIIKDRNIRWGIIGLGSIAHKFASDLIKVTGSELYAVASRSADKAQAFSNQYNASIAYSSYEQLVKDEQVDAIYIATPHALHQDNTLLCLEHGKAVLCEKPFAMDSQQVNTMIACAQKHNTLLMEALWTYFLPHYQFVLRELANKTYGNIVKLEANFGFFREFDDNSRLFNKALGGGSLLDIGIYPIFTALSTLGKPKSITAQASYFDNGADSSCSMSFEYERATATLESTLLDDTSNKAIFYCETGTIKINKGFHGLTTVTIFANNDEEVFDFGYQDHGYNLHGYKYEIEHFNELLRQGKTESDIMSFEFSRVLINTLDDVRRLIGLNY